MRVAFALLFSAAALQAQGLTPFARQKAVTLLENQLSCLGCHEYRGHGGRSAPSLTTVGERRSPKYIRAIIEDPQTALPGVAMPKHVMAPQVRDLVAQFLSEGARGADTPRLTAPRTATSPSGPLLYEKWCASCHGATGTGDGINARDLPVKPANHADGVAMSKRADDALYDVIAAGGLQTGRSARMPAFGQTLSRAEIRALVAQLRRLCNCKAPGWSADGKRP